ARGCGGPARDCGTARWTHRPLASAACSASSNWRGWPAEARTGVEAVRLIEKKNENFLTKCFGPNQIRFVHVIVAVHSEQITNHGQRRWCSRAINIWLLRRPASTPGKSHRKTGVNKRERLFPGRQLPMVDQGALTVIVPIQDGKADELA